MAEEGGGGGVPDWILTYGDMMSLLLCFFVLLYSFAGGEKTASQDQMIESIVKQFGDSHDLAMFYLRKQLNSVGKPGIAVTQNDNGELKKKHANQSQPGLPGDQSLITDVRDGKRLIIGGPVLFAAGSATMTDDAKESAMVIADLLRGKFHMIEIRGFEPPALPSGATDFRDTLDLAYARVRTVAAFFAKEGGIPNDLLRLSIAAPAEAATLPRLPSGEPGYNRVVISTLELTPADLENAGQ